VRNLFSVPQTSSSSCGLSCDGQCHSYEHVPCLSIMRSVIGSCQTNVAWCQIWFNVLEPNMACWAWSAIPFPWQIDWLQSINVLALALWPKNFRRVVWMCVSSGLPVCRQTSSLKMRALQGTCRLVVYDTDTAMHFCPCRWAIMNKSFVAVNTATIASKMTIAAVN